MGLPKALVQDAAGGWLQRAVDTLSAAGCSPVVVVLGARAEEAEAVVAADPRVHLVIADDWASGLGASLRAGLVAAACSDADAAAITLVDLPSLTVGSVVRVLGSERHPEVLRQAFYDGAPGHPVLVGRRHFEPLAASVSGDAGARRYLEEHGAEAVDCSDLGGGDDVDSRP